MFLFLEKVKSFLQSGHGATSTSVVIPLPSAKHSYAPLIPIEAWLDLPIHRRAPARSVVLVEVIGDRFLAVVIDTVADRPRWVIDAGRGELSRLYEGALGCDEDHGRGVVVISAPRLARSLTPVNLDRDAVLIAIKLGDDDCDPPIVYAQVPSQDPGGGSPGFTVPPPVTGAARVISNVSGGLAGACPVQITDAHGGMQDALLVPSGSFL